MPLGGAWCPSHPPVTSGAILGVAQQEAGRANLTLPLDDVDESALDGHVQDASRHAVQLPMKKDADGKLEAENHLAKADQPLASGDHTKFSSRKMLAMCLS